MLEKVRELVATSWTQEAYARDAEGKELDSAFNSEAVTFCLLGACHKVEGEVEGPLVKTLRQKVKEKTGRSLITAFNDSSTHEEVLAFLDGIINA
jgi:hypothetical protein